jgi:cell division protein ZipA
VPLDDLPPPAPEPVAPAVNRVGLEADDKAAAPTPLPRAVAAKPPTKSLEKLLSLLIAERDGNHIRGPAIHEALTACELEFGARKIYHRFYEGRPVFSVASLLKPGYLVPQQAEQFSTPGLAMFMVLPGPQNAADAIREMLTTAQRLAKMLNAEVYDAKRKLLSEPAAKALQTEVENWARLNLTS